MIESMESPPIPALAQAARTADPPDERLVEAARAGDRGSWTALYQRFSGLVHGVLLARAPRAEVEDLAQDVFLRAYAHLATLRDASAFGPWIAVLARNRARDFQRSARPSEQLPDDFPADDAGHEEAVRVLVLVRSLPEAYHETLILRFVEGMTGPEIASATGLTPGSVRVNLHRGTKLLREKLRGEKTHE